MSSALDRFPGNKPFLMVTIYLSSGSTTRREQIAESIKERILESGIGEKYQVTFIGMRGDKDRIQYDVL